MAQNTNFKGNKNNNQKRKLPYLNVRIDKLVDVEDCNTKAFASVTVGGAFAIHGIRVMNSRNQSDEFKERIVCRNACK